MPLADTLSPRHAGTSPKMATPDIVFIAAGLVVACIGTFFFCQQSIAEAAAKGLDGSVIWLSYFFFPTGMILTMLAGLLTVVFMVEANQRNQGSLLVLALLSFFWMSMPLVSGSTHNVLMARHNVLSLLVDIRKDGRPSSEEARLLKALEDNDEKTLDEASQYLGSRPTQELVQIAQGLGMNTEQMNRQGFATPAQIRTVWQEAERQGAPAHVFKSLEPLQHVELRFKQDL